MDLSLVIQSLLRVWWGKYLWWMNCPVCEVSNGWSVYGGWTVQWVKCLWWVKCPWWVKCLWWMNCSVGKVSMVGELCSGWSEIPPKFSTFLKFFYALNTNLALWRTFWKFDFSLLGCIRGFSTWGTRIWKNFLILTTGRYPYESNTPNNWTYNTDIKTKLYSEGCVKFKNLICCDEPESGICT
jgi:hypothetical protein